VCPHLERRLHYVGSLLHVVSSRHAKHLTRRWSELRKHSQSLILFSSRPCARSTPFRRTHV
jgi:hypothetical protein